MRDRVLVVGGAGYIGGAITDILKEHDCDMMVYDMLLYERDYRKDVPFVLGDVLDTQRLSKVIADFKPTAIIWLAAIVGDGACQVIPELTQKVNEGSVEWLANHSHFNGRIVFTSTCSVYGKADELLDEDSDKNPLSLYAVTKLQAEEHLKGKNAVIFRLGTLHGVSDTYSRIRLDLVANILCLKAMRGMPLTVFGGEQWRPLLHVRDAAKAIAHAALVNEIKDNVAPGIYNIAERNATIRELGDGIRNAAPIEPKPKVEYSEISFEDARNYRVSFDRYKAQPGAVEFTLTVEESAKEMMDLIAEGRVKDPFGSNFHNARFMKEYSQLIQQTPPSA